MEIGLAVSLSAAGIIALLKIVAIDIILSGDNAVVIAMATRRLPENRRNIAIVWGTGGAIVLRIFFAAVIALLLGIPFVHFFGGMLLLWIAYKVLVNNEGEATSIKAKDGVMQAISTIIVADAVMSLDNVVAIAGASNGHISLIAIGVMISIPIMIFGSKLIVQGLQRFPWIAYIGSGILAWTAGGMIIGDKEILEILHIKHGAITYIFTIIITVLVLVLGYVKNRRITPSM